MRSYVMMIAGGAMLSAFADIMVPNAWRKYMRIITGFILLAVIMSPAARFEWMDLFRESFSIEEVEYTPMPQMVADELEKRVEEDAEERIKNKCGAVCEVDVAISVNTEGLIENVENITVKTTSTQKGMIQKLLCEIYGVEEVEFLSQGNDI